MMVPAKGVQIYECRAKKDASAGFEWVFVAPEAELFDAARQQHRPARSGAVIGNPTTAAGSLER